jgi:hypothetical protein
MLRDMQSDSGNSLQLTTDPRQITTGDLKDVLETTKQHSHALVVEPRAGRAKNRLARN